MLKKILPLVVIVSITVFCWADVPAPPVNQDVGMLDTRFLENVEEADCRICHSSGMPDRHHLLMGQPIFPGSLVPYPDSDGDGIPDTEYVCLSCHDVHAPVVRDCVACHTESPHHTTAIADGGHCVACHGDLVDDFDDGHYIPTYEPSLVTPWRGLDGDEGEPVGGEPLNEYGFGAGACTYCHDADVDPSVGDPLVIYDPHDTHHRAGWDGLGSRCDWCHNEEFVDGDRNFNFNGQIRTCEKCHGPDSLHNIQVDSPNPANIGTLVVGAEDAGYGHVGNNDDCWGCHGFAMSGAPDTGPIVPTVHASDRTVIRAGADTMVVLTGSAFKNIAAGVPFDSDVELTAADGSSVTLPTIVSDQEELAVTIPGDTAPGNYKVRAVKPDGANSAVTSNPVVVSIVPEVAINRATAARNIVTIAGSGFGGYAKGLGTSVTASARQVRRANEATIVSWSDTKIVASFRSTPKEVTVHSVFGSDTIEVSRLKTTSVKGRGGISAISTK